MLSLPGRRSMQKDRKCTGRAKCLMMVVLIALTLPNFLLVTSASASSDSGIFVDLFTQKAPFDGRGINQSSDTFGPQEQVILYALVLRDDAPVNGTLVTYDVLGPPNASGDIRFFQTAETNSSGIATTEFSLAVVNQTEAFGTWNATASVQVEGKTYGDTLTFKVDYIIKTISIRTLNENLTETKNFGEGGYVGFEIALENNARIKKNTTLAITVFDELGVPVSSSQIDDLIVPPGRIQYFYGSVPISNLAVPGNATITAVALENTLVAYGPQISAGFSIQPFNPIFPTFIDACVYVEASPAIVEAGETVMMSLLVMNQGTVSLNDFYATLAVNDSLLSSYFISFLGPYQSQAFEFDWNTTGLSEGIYVITAEVPAFPHEANLSDNTYSVQVEVMAKKPTLIHDIEVAYANSSENVVYQGEIVILTVGVRNNGNFTESTNASVYYDDVLIEKRSVQELLPQTEQIIVFEWDTTNVPIGSYQIIARADSVQGETNLANNIYYDGSVQIKLPLRPPPMLPSRLFALTFFAFTLAAGVIAFVFLLIMLDYLKRRRKRRRSESRFALIAHHGLR
jgi:hypothetical protein